MMFIIQVAQQQTQKEMKTFGQEDKCKMGLLSNWLLRHELD